ncbi:hypothetical protein HID58_083680, partial [Brassica napus]
MFFQDVSPGPHETQLRFCLIHFWEAWNPLKKTLIGIEMLLIDEQGTVIQGFISPGRIERYLPKMKPGSVYKLNNFYGSSNKSVYRVSDHAVTVSFSWNSELSSFGTLSIGTLSAGPQANGNQGVTQEVPVPKALLSTIGQKHNFCVKVTKHNLDE